MIGLNELGQKISAEYLQKMRAGDARICLQPGPKDWHVSNRPVHVWNQAKTEWEQVGKPDGVRLDVSRVSSIEAMFVAIQFTQLLDGPKCLYVSDPEDSDGVEILAR